MSGIRSAIYQAVLLAVATFFFLVLFQHGTADFVKNARGQFAELRELARGSR